MFRISKIRFLFARCMPSILLILMRMIRLRGMRMRARLAYPRAGRPFGIRWSDATVQYKSLVYQVSFYSPISD